MSPTSPMNLPAASCGVSKPKGFPPQQAAGNYQVKQLHPIIIFCDHHRTSRVPGSADPDQPLLEKDALAQTIDLRNAVGTPAEGAEDPETAEHGK